MINQYTFWKLLTERRVTIPIIQRDYAQGREGKEYIRKNFLEQLSQALFNGKNVELDFVYGTEVRPKASDTIEMFPLDGQQRLTTLWLLYWYVAYKSGQLPKSKEVLKRFSYETRTSSRDFCEKLCDLSFDKDDEPIVHIIKDQTWFFSTWNQDPTISSMLRMLSGTNNSQDKNFIDGIEKLFTDKNKLFTGKKDFPQYWKTLIGDNCPIVFNFLPLQSSELPLSDDLYIKMNARGKALTDFENFKADLIDWIYQEEKGVDFISLIDNGWTDIFWKKDHHIDDTFFAFVNRFFLNQAIVKGLIKIEKSEIIKGKDIWTLYGNSSDDSDVKYLSFDIYETIMDSQKDKGQNVLELLENIFARLKDHDLNKYFPSWAQNSFDDFNFIPIYKDSSDSVSTLTQPQRVLFYAICKYFETSTFDEDSFKRWMRVVCNLIENPIVNTIDTMIGRIKLIDELGEHCDDIYEFLASEDCQIQSKVADSQVAEERAKAKEILSQDTEGASENLILEAEEYAFFHGAIRFLFTDQDGHVDWTEFARKFSNAKNYFNDGGVKDASKYKVVTALIKLVPDWKLLYEEQIFTTKADTWKYWILCNEEYRNPVHYLLLCNNLDTIEYSDMIAPDPVEIYRHIRRLFCGSGLINVVIDNHDEYRFKLRWNGPLALYRPYGGQGNPIVFDFPINSGRREILSSLLSDNKITVNDEFIVNGTNPMFFYGWDVPFQYESGGVKYDFCWSIYDWVDMYEGDEKLYDKGGICQEIHAHFAGKEKEISFTDKNSLIEKLERCIKIYNEWK